MKLSNKQMAVCYVSMVNASDDEIKMLLLALNDEKISKWFEHMNDILNISRKDNKNERFL